MTRNKIIHWTGVVSGNIVRYNCNWAVNPNPDKVTNNYRKVTCKNCLRELKKKKVVVNHCHFVEDDVAVKKKAKVKK